MGHAKIDDLTTARILELHRARKPNGGRWSFREIAKETDVSLSTVQRTVQSAHEETLGEARREIRERVAQSLDVNVDRMTQMADLLATAARTGEWPDEDAAQETTEPKKGNKVVGMTRVQAAKEAVHASDRIVAIMGVNAEGPSDPDEVVRRVDRILGITEPDDDEWPAPDEHPPIH